MLGGTPLSSGDCDAFVLDEHITNPGEQLPGFFCHKMNVCKK